jgi:hypothetical protein
VTLPGYEPVATYGSAAEAEVVRSLLAASGIDARVAGAGHLLREHVPAGEISVLVPAAEVGQAREIIASAREPAPPELTPREPSRPPSASRAPRPPGSLWRSGIVVGLSFSAFGALTLLFQPGAVEAGRRYVVVGLLFAVVGAIGGAVQRARRARGRG